jgi:glycosyltransferase XagB
VEEFFPVTTLVNALVLAVAVVLGGIALITICWQLYAWWTPSGLARTRFRRPQRAQSDPLTFSVIVPARHEDAVLGHTLDRLAAADHESFEVLCVVGDDDPDTAAVARAAAARHPHRTRVLVDYATPKSKPKALNRALPECMGDVVGVFDAEDEVSTELLGAVEWVFTRDRADAVQGGVQLMNFHTSWWALRNVLEYFFWFRSRLHYHSDRQFIPLGGNTVFVRREVLERAGGWDPECLAEDCDLGVRLSAHGANISVAYDASLATREETPGSLTALFKQRTRWDQGFLQVLHKGEWRQMPTIRQRALASYTLLSPFLQALTGLLVPVSLALMFLARTPAPITLVSLTPLLLVLATVVIEAVALHEFAQEFAQTVRVRDHVRLVLGTVPYQWLLAAAAVRAVWRELRAQRDWEKTAHSNLHRNPYPLEPRSARDRAAGGVTTAGAVSR